MLDRYSVEKLIDAHRAEAVENADRDRLASAAGGRRKVRRLWPIAAKLRGLAAAGLRLAPAAPPRVPDAGPN
jgi:hypothetical protein